MFSGSCADIHGQMDMTKLIGGNAHNNKFLMNSSLYE